MPMMLRNIVENFFCACVGGAMQMALAILSDNFIDHLATYIG